MRRTLIALLLASALGPAAASAQDDGYERGSRSETERSVRASDRDSAREARSQRVDRVERREPATPVKSTGGMERAERQGDRLPRSNQSTDLDRAMRSDHMQPSDRVDRTDRRARTGRTDSDPQPVQQVETPVIAQPAQQSDRHSDSLADGFRQVARDNASGRDKDHDDSDWKHDWRKDKRYDWWHYRSRYGSLYRLGYYRDPYGWGYRRWSAGYSLWPSYYGSSFWLDDPWMYRLPAAYGPYRWVRYYDDALLVNIYTGQVVDTVYNFFW